MYRRDGGSSVVEGKGQCITRQTSGKGATPTTRTHGGVAASILYMNVYTSCLHHAAPGFQHNNPDTL